MNALRRYLMNNIIEHELRVKHNGAFFAWKFPL